MTSDVLGGPTSKSTEGGSMSKLKLNITMSIDGFVAGPDQSPEHPLGVGGEEGALGGGAAVAQQYLAAGLVDEIVVSVVPILLGGGARLFEKVGDVKLEQVESVEAPGVTHIRYARASA